MSDTVARQGARIQLEQSNMRLALNMAKMAKWGLSCAAIEESQYLIKELCAEVCGEQKREVEFPGHRKAKAPIESHPAMVCKNWTDSCLHCQNGTAMSLQTGWRRKRMGAPPPHRLRQLTPEPTPPPPVTPPGLLGDNGESQASWTEGMPLGYVYIHAAFSKAQCFNVDAYAKDWKGKNDFILNLLTNEETCTC